MVAGGVGRNSWGVDIGEWILGMGGERLVVLSDAGENYVRNN